MPILDCCNAYVRAQKSTRSNASGSGWWDGNALQETRTEGEVA
jgi:hypothetical protein